MTVDGLEAQQQQRPASGAATPARWSVFVVVLGATLLGAAMRMVAARDAFWLDEIWSYLFARDISSLAEVFTKYRVDNNHPLNTLWMWLVGDRLWWPIYRLPAVVCGVATIPLAAMWLGRRSRAAAMVVAAMFALSFPMLVYSSEARGYGPAVCFAMLCLIAADRDTVGALWLAVFGASAILGMLAHLTFIPFYLALVAWTLWRYRRSLWSFAALQAAPSLFLIAYYFSFIRGMTVGGAPPVSLVQALADGLAMTYGISTGAPPVVRLVVALVAIAFAAWFIARLWRRADDRWILFAFGMFLCPLGIVLARSLLGSASAYDFVYPRYFLIPLALLLLAASETIGECFVMERSRAGTRAAAVSIVALLLFGIGNVIEDARFLRHGRGDYLGAMRYMYERTNGPILTLSSDNNYRAKMVVAFYARYLPAGAQVRYVDSADSRNPGALPQWMIVHADEPDAEPADQIDMGFGVRFRLERSFPQYGPSGWTWHIYRLVGSGTSGT